MNIDYRTLLAEEMCRPAEAVSYEFDLADAILATRIPDLCPNCNEHGMRWMGRVTDDGDGPWVHCTHPTAPTIADLLRWGENLLVATEGRGGLIHLRGLPLRYTDDYELLAALRTEADR